MDALKNFAAKASGGSSSNTAATGNTANTANAGQKEDYGDKAFDFLAKKTGHSVDRNTSEKITDGARAAYEKATGKKVDPKYSN